VAGLVVRPRSRLLHGHDWVYSTEVLKVFGAPVDGDVISLRDSKDRLLGSAIYNSRSQIVARRFSRKRQDLDADFFERRIAQALNYRKRRQIDLQACRLVWSESDGIPGLIVDRYGDCVVLQTLTLAMDQRLPLIIEAVAKVVSPRSIIERNDAAIRRAEGMELRSGILLGEEPGIIPITIGGLKFEIDTLHGHKTGFYLDQIENYSYLAPWATGRRVLDCFSNQGAFALRCANAGAEEVTAVEISADLTAQIEANAKRNQLDIRVVTANVFDFFKCEENRGAEYDLIILDPPSFTKSKGKLHDAMRGYKEIHLRALKLLTREGLLATYSCSHHVSFEIFDQMIVEALVDAKRTARQICRFQQAPDHPILPAIPETQYLKGTLLEMVPGR
jgi:23S rRNA (cytosine1962-C5)-methyltransferase